MHLLTCLACGAPIEAQPAEAQAGAAKCPYCGSMNQIAEKVVVHIRDDSGQDRRVKIGSDDAKLLPEELYAPVARPKNTKMVVEQQPGVRFYALLAGREPNTAEGLLIGAGVVGLLVAIIAVSDWRSHRLANWPALIVPTLIVAALLWAALACFRQRIFMNAEAEKITLFNQHAFHAERQTYDWNQVTEFRFSKDIKAENKDADDGEGKPQNEDREKDEENATYLLFMHLGGRIVPIWAQCACLTAAEQRWLVQELNRFFAPIWAARQEHEAANAPKN